MFLGKYNDDDDDDDDDDIWIKQNTGRALSVTKGLVGQVDVLVGKKWPAFFSCHLAKF